MSHDDTPKPKIHSLYRDQHVISYAFRCQENNSRPTMLNFLLMLWLALVKNMALTLDREAKTLHKAREQADCDSNRNRDGWRVGWLWRFKNHVRVIGSEMKDVQVCCLGWRRTHSYPQTPPFLSLSHFCYSTVPDLDMVIWTALPDNPQQEGPGPP